MEKREETLSPKLEKQINSLISLISKLDHIEFIGLAKILSVQLLKENKEPKSFEDILSEILDNFAKLSSKGRKEILQLLSGTLKVKKTKNRKNRNVGDGEDGD